MIFHSRLSRALLTLTAVSLLMAGCARHQPQPVTLPGLPPEHFAGEEGTSAPAPPVGRWWKAFGDARLDALVDEALAGDLDLRVAYARLDSLRALTTVASAAGKPVVNLKGQASLDHQPGLAGSHTGVNARLSLEAGYEIDLWDKLESREVAARLEQEATREEIEALTMSLAARLVDLYYLAVEQRAQLDLTDGTVASFEGTLARVEERYRQGLVPALDIYQAQQNLLQARSRRPLFEATLARTEHALSLLLGRYPGGDFFGELAILPATPEAWPAGLPSELLARRPDIRAASLRLRASDARVAAAVADRFPSFNLLAGFGLSRTSLAAGDVTGIFWNFLTGLAQPLLDGGRREAEVERNKATFRESVALYHKAVLRAFQDVEDALTDNRATEARLVMLAERVKATDGALRLSTDRYLQGLSEYLPVLTAQILHFEARSQLLTARRQQISDRVSLARALGGNWMAEEFERRSAEERGQQGEPVPEEENAATVEQERVE